MPYVVLEWRWKLGKEKIILCEDGRLNQWIDYLKSNDAYDIEIKELSYNPSKYASKSKKPPLDT
jgi:hypothetical protein